ALGGAQRGHPRGARAARAGRAPPAPARRDRPLRVRGRGERGHLGLRRRGQRPGHGRRGRPELRGDHARRRGRHVGPARLGAARLPGPPGRHHRLLLPRPHGGVEPRGAPALPRDDRRRGLALLEARAGAGPDPGARAPGL
ncbi:MAG: hypothetical protein AVDCRST_MAG13-670, partial [uncultured Solirubrobacteraceae bacterium]